MFTSTGYFIHKDRMRLSANSAVTSMMSGMYWLHIPGSLLIIYRKGVGVNIVLLDESTWRVKGYDDNLEQKWKYVCTKIWCT